MTWQEHFSTCHIQKSNLRISWLVKNDITQINTSLFCLWLWQNHIFSFRNCTTLSIIKLYHENQSWYKTKVGSQNFGYQLWFCTRLIICYTKILWFKCDFIEKIKKNMTMPTAEYVQIIMHGILGWGCKAVCLIDVLTWYRWVNARKT